MNNIQKTIELIYNTKDYKQQNKLEEQLEDLLKDQKISLKELKEDLDISNNITYGHYILCHAARYGNHHIFKDILEIVKNDEYLLKQWLTTNIANYNNPLIEAVKNDHINIVNIILDYAKNSYSQEDKSTLTRILSSYHNVYPHYDYTALELAIKKGNTEATKLILNAAATDINILTKLLLPDASNEDNLLKFAIKQNNSAAVKLILDCVESDKTISSNELLNHLLTEDNLKLAINKGNHKVVESILDSAKVHNKKLLENLNKNKNLYLDFSLYQNYIYTDSTKVIKILIKNLKNKNYQNQLIELLKTNYDKHEFIYSRRKTDQQKYLLKAYTELLCEDNNIIGKNKDKILEISSVLANDMVNGNLKLKKGGILTKKQSDNILIFIKYFIICTSIALFCISSYFLASTISATAGVNLFTVCIFAFFPLLLFCSILSTATDCALHTSKFLLSSNTTIKDSFSVEELEEKINEAKKEALKGKLSSYEAVNGKLPDYEEATKDDTVPTYEEATLKTVSHLEDVDPKTKLDDPSLDINSIHQTLHRS